MKIAVVSLKGGVGRSAISTNLAGMRTSLGRRVVLVDTDRWGLTTVWCDRRYAAMLPRVNSEYTGARRCEDLVRHCAGMYDDIIVDGHVYDRDDLYGALVAVDCVAVPVLLSLADVPTVSLMEQFVKTARKYNAGLRALVVVNRALLDRPDSEASSKAMEYLKRECRELAVSGARIHEGSEYQEAFARSRAVAELDAPGDRARYGIESLYEEIFNERYVKLEDRQGIHVQTARA